MRTDSTNSKITSVLPTKTVKLSANVENTTTP